MKTLSQITGGIAQIGNQLNLVKERASWPNLRLPAIIGSVLGFAGDYLSPIFNHVLLWTVLVVLVLALVSWVAYLINSFNKWNARSFLTSLTTLVIVVIIALANTAVEAFSDTQDEVDPHRGLLVTAIESLSDLQTTLLIRSGQIQAELEMMNDEMEKQTRILEKIEDGTDVTGDTLKSVDQKMELDVALNIMWRALQERDSSQQGQVEALELLIGRGYEYSNADFSGVSFKGGNLKGINLQSARMHFTDLQNANMTKSNLNGVGMRFANASHANFSDADLSESYNPLIVATGADFSHADLSSAYFVGGDFQGADFSGANLTGASFALADVRGAKFDNANLADAFFVGAVMDNVSFQGATFSNTDFRAANAEHFKLDSLQLAGICQHPERKRSGGLKYIEWNAELVERFPSDRFSSGYEFNELRPKKGVFYIDDSPLPRCKNEHSEIGDFNTRYPSHIRLHLDRYYLSKARRRNFAVERANKQFDLLKQSITQERELKPIW